MKILIAGDYCPRYRVEPILDSGNYSTVFGEVKPIVSKADYSIVNFECPVIAGEETPIPKCGPNLKCNDNAVKALAYAGFKCVTLANNHFLDQGENGVNDTLRVLTENGIESVGGGKNLKQASQILYKKIDNKILAVINCCENEFSIATDNTAGSNPLNPIQQYYAIKEARNKSDYVLVIVHGGHEHIQLPSLRMVETYRFFIEAGADALVNHHQHCYGGYEVYKGKLIFYGLGNLCFDSVPVSYDDLWNYGYMVSIDFNDNITFEMFPYLQCAQEPCVKVLDKNIFEQNLHRLNSVISDTNELRKVLEEQYEKKINMYKSIFEPFQNKYYLELVRRGWIPSSFTKTKRLMASNFILCESHRDILKWWLEKSYENKT